MFLLSPSGLEQGATAVLGILVSFLPHFYSSFYSSACSEYVEAPFVTCPHYLFGLDDCPFDLLWHNNHMCPAFDGIMRVGVMQPD